MMRQTLGNERTHYNKEFCIGNQVCNTSVQSKNIAGFNLNQTETLVRHFNNNEAFFKRIFQ